MQKNDYRLPDIGSLTPGNVFPREDGDRILRARDILERTLESFGIAGEVSGYTSGPRVTRFEITLAPGVSARKVERIADNLALDLAATSVRVSTPIPGRPVVGVEVSTPGGEDVPIRFVAESEAWRNGTAEIPLAIGVDTAGEPVVIDLHRAPDVLISGAAGTGKSVFIDSLIAGLLLKFRPDELKLVLIDPGLVGFENYRDLPHLLAPVVSDASRAAAVFRWLSAELDRRYMLMARAHAKHIVDFNRRPTDPEPVRDAADNEIPAQMPYIVVVINELADLMTGGFGKEIEADIVRIAQKSKAAGIHLVVSTRRPKKNILTGAIKANLPTRFCFRMRSGADSRLVLDADGAEKLLGRGDMLFMSPYETELRRLQGAYVPERDLRGIVDFVCAQAKPGFAAGSPTVGDGDAAFDAPAPAPDDDDPREREMAFFVAASKFVRDGDDDITRLAVALILRERKASTSFLQRRLKIGFSRAAEIIDELEARKLLSPPSGGGGKRDILAATDITER